MVTSQLIFKYAKKIGNSVVGQAVVALLVVGLMAVGWQVVGGWHTKTAKAAVGVLAYSGYNIGQATSTGNFDPAAIGVSQSLEYVFEPGSAGMIAYLFESGGGGSNANKLILSTPYDISSYTSFSTFGTPTNTTDIIYNNDGSKAYYTSYVSNRIYEYDLATNYDLSTGTAVDNFDYDVIVGEIDVYSSAFNYDGTKLFAAGEDTETIYEFDLLPAYDVSTAVPSGVSLDLTPFYTAAGNVIGNSNVRTATFAQEGRRIYVVNDLIGGGFTFDTIIEIELATAYDLTTAAFVGSIDVTGVSPIISMSSVSFDETGQQMFLTSSGGEIYGFDTNQGYAEAVTNDGSIDNSVPLVITLTGDTFADIDADDILDIGSEVTIGNVPAGLIPSVALTAGDTVATLTFSGNAIDHQDIDDVGNLTFEFDDTAFTGGVASTIDNSGNSTAYNSFVGINFEDNPQVSGTVYTDEGATNIGAGKTVTLLIDGALADCGGGAGSCQADTDAGGRYFIQGTDIDVMTGGEILTVFIDNETEQGVTVTVTEDASQTGLDIYQDYLITRHDNAGELTNANLAAATNADTDIDALYTVAGTVITTTSGTELLVWAGDSFTPGGDVIAGGTVDINGTLDIGVTSISIAGDLDTGNTLSTTAGSSITMNGTGAQSYNQGSSQINADLIVSGTGVVSLVTNRLLLGANDLTISAGATLNINGMNITTATGVFSNEGTLQVTGEELLINLTQDTDSGAWEFIDDVDGSASVVSIDGTPFPSTYYNLVINDTEAAPGNRDTFQITTTDLTVNNNMTVTSGTFSTGAFHLDIDGNYVQEINGLFSGNASTINLAGNFTNRAGVGFSADTSTLVLDVNTDHSITGDTVFNNLTFQNTSDDASNNTLTFGNGSNYIVGGNLVLGGLDANDQILIVSDSASNAAVLNILGGSANINADFLTITDNTLQDNGVIMSPALDVANSINGGNTAGWFGAASIEFSEAIASSTDESAADDFPVLLINGTTTAAATVDVNITGGSATSGGVDYTSTNPITVSIPAGTYDGTAGTGIAITAPTINNDLIIEGAETIIYGLSNFSTSEIAGGDANGDTTNQSTHTYTITDDDGLAVAWSAAAQNSPEATGSAPTVTVSGAQILSAVTVEVANVGTGSAAGSGGDYAFTSPATITIPTGDYTTASTIAITGLSIIDESDLEADETIDLVLQNPSAGLTIGTQSTATYTIINDDTATVSIAATDTVAAENPSDNGEFTITMNTVNNTGSAVTVNYLVSGSATEGADFAALAGSATIADGDSDDTILIDTTGLDDGLVEGNETVTVTITGTNNANVTTAATAAATLSISDDEDADGDGISTVDENAGFNGGDGNGDGILDSAQSDVTNFANPVTGGTTTVDITGSATCNVVSQVQGLDENTLTSTDGSYDYPVGLVQFLIECTGPGDTANIEIYYDQVYDTTDWEFRKYNPNNGSFTDIDATVTVTISPETLASGGQTVTKASYQVTDGSVLDVDASPSLIDRFIFDPAGPGTPVTVAATTSSSSASGSRKAVCKDPDALNYNSQENRRHQQELCEYPQQEEILEAITEASGLSCPIFNEYHKLGDSGSGVKAAQAFLRVKGLYQGDTDGVFDEEVKQAVVAFQESYSDRILAPWGLTKGTGWLYQSTRAHMNVLSGCDVCVTLDNGQKVGCDESVNPAPVVVALEADECPHFTQYYQSGDRAGEIPKIQRFLTDQGFEPGGVDGIMGANTIEAIKRFQAAFAKRILQPWGHTTPTGRWYQTTRHQANALAGCPADLPELVDID